MNDKIIIGMDHGYGYLKTKNHVMLNGVNPLSSEPPFLNHVIAYEGQYYTIGESRQKYVADKTANNNYYILTLAALAEEMKQRNLNTGKIVLGAGLPYSFWNQRDKFCNYLKKNDEVKFKYGDEGYYLSIDSVYIFPQCYPIAIKRADKLRGKTRVVDVGSGTVDVITFIDKTMQLSESYSFRAGTIECIELIQKEFMSQHNFTLDEYIIQEVMQGADVTLTEEYREFVIQLIKSYVQNNVLDALAQKGLNFEFDMIVVAGGMASVIERFYPELTEKPNIDFETDIKANAIGFEDLAVAYSEKHCK